MRMDSPVMAPCVALTRHASGEVLVGKETTLMMGSLGPSSCQLSSKHITFQHDASHMHYPILLRTNRAARHHSCTSVLATWFAFDAARRQEHPTSITRPLTQRRTPPPSPPQDNPSTL